MTNGLAVGVRDIYARDYWHNNTACSGYSFKGETTMHCLKAFKFGTDGRLPRKGWDSSAFKEYSPDYRLAVPEQLVWWEYD